jgi:hypothetical protein
MRASVVVNGQSALTPPRPITALFPGGHPLFQRGAVRHALGPAARQHAPLNLGPIEPGAVLGRVVNLQAARPASSFLGWKCLIKARCRMSVPLVHDQHDLLGVPLLLVDQMPHKVRPIPTFPRVRYGNVPPAGARLKGEEHAGYAVAHLDAVVAFHRARLDR